MANFAQTLNFTSSNEDGATELSALAIQPEDRVLCLTASGTRPLDLLLGNPSTVFSIDFNSAQNELLRLKIAAIETLNDEELYAWLGLSPSRSRLRLQARVEQRLPPASKAFWSARQRVIAAGIWHTGRWERVLRLGALGTGLVRGRFIRQLFEAATLEEQATIWRDHFDDRLWQASIQLLARPWFWTRIIGEPGGAFLPAPAASTARLTGLFRRAAENFFFRDSDFAHLIFRGRLSAQDTLPIHLRRENLPLVRERLDRIHISDEGLSGLGARHPEAFDAFSLSDFGSYCSGAAYDDCWAGILSAARPGARFCERIFMNPVRPGTLVAARLSENTALGNALTRTDRAIIYDIRCGALLPA
ncbi:DUF3419 family protein [Hyphomonas sp.]|uniref:DUF3419 family protein n=1 Tax=Hyphomonas sp. TaxID=87 RepID=UPI00391C803E